MKTSRKAGPIMVRTLLFVCALFALFSTLLPRGEAADLQAPVRVGYSSTGAMLYQDEGGRYRGYGAMYLYEIARYTGWTYTFVPYDNWAQAVADVAAGRIDLLPTVLKTPEREQQMRFSIYPMAQTKIALVKRPDDTRYAYGAAASLATARIGVRTGTADTREFETWMQRSGLICAAEVSYDDRHDMLAALDAGDIDLVATSYVGDVRHYPAVHEFSPQPMYFAVAPQRPDVATALDRAMEQSFLYNPDFVRDITTLTQPENHDEAMLLSDDERAYLQALPTLRVAFLADNAPISYERDGEMRGIGVRVIERLADLTGLSFEIVKIENRDDAVAAIHDGRLDLLGSTFLSILRPEDEGLRLTTSYYRGTAALLERPGRQDPRIAVGSSTRAYLLPDKKDAPNLVTYPYTTNAMQAFAAGDIDAAYCDTATASYYMAAIGRRNVNITVLTNAPIHIGMALAPDADPRLALVLDRVLHYIDVTESDAIVQQEAARAPLTLGTVFDRLTTTQMNAVLLALILLLAALGYFAFLIWRQKSMEQRAARVSRAQEQLTADLAWEKKVGAAQMGFYRYIDANILGPMTAASRSLARKGAADPKNPYHEEFLRVWQMLDFLFEVRTLNALTQDDPGTLVREHHSPYYQPDPDWQPTPCRAYLERQAAIAQITATNKGVTFGADFSGVLDLPVLMEPRGMSMVIMRILSYLLRMTPKNGVVLFSAALSRMAAENGVSLTADRQANFQSLGIDGFHGSTLASDIRDGGTSAGSGPQAGDAGTTDRAVLWLFFHAPQFHLLPAFQEAAAAMRESAQQNPRGIYESLLAAQHKTREENRQLLRLAILQLIIPALGGEWEVHATEEKGTEITVEFLVDLAPQEKRNEKKKAFPSGEGGPR